MSCRFYEQERPDLEDIVFVQIKDENEYGFHVDLLEYCGLEGFVSKSQLVKKRTRKKRILRIGDKLPMVVLSADEKHVNVSKRRLHEPDIPDFMQKYKFASYLNRVCLEIYNLYRVYCKTKGIKFNIEPETIASECIWELVEEYNHSYEDVYNEVVSNPDTIFKNSSLPDEFKQRVCAMLKDHIVSKDMLIETNLNLAVYSIGGVNTLKEVLDETKFSSIDPEYKISIQMVSPPIYKIIVGGPTVEGGVHLTESILNEIKKSVKGQKSSFSSNPHRVVREPVFQLKPISDYTIEHTEF